MKKFYIAANWKMNMNRAEAKALAEEMKAGLKNGKNKYMIAPSFTLLQDVASVLKGSNILLGAQNMGLEEKGAHTGEVSVLQLFGCRCSSRNFRPFRKKAYIQGNR